MRYAGLCYSGLPVAGIAAAFVAGSYALLGLPPSEVFVALAVAGSFLVYQAERAVWPAPEDAVNHPQRRAWVQRHRTFVWTSVALAGLVVLALLPFVRVSTLAAGAALAAVSLAYRLPLLPGRRRLKSLGLAKPLAIAGAWATGGVLLPALEAGAAISGEVLALVAYRFCFVLPNALLADWPDRAGDARAGLATPALRLSVRRLHAVAAAVLGLAVAGGLVALAYCPRPGLLLIDLGGPVLFLGIVLWPGRRSRFFYRYLIDLVIAWPGLTAVAASLGLGG